MTVDPDSVKRQLETLMEEMDHEIQQAILPIVAKYQNKLDEKKEMLKGHREGLQEQERHRKRQRQEEEEMDAIEYKRQRKEIEEKTEELKKKTEELKKKTEELKKKTQELAQVEERTRNLRRVEMEKEAEQHKRHCEELEKIEQQLEMGLNFQIDCPALAA